MEKGQLSDHFNRSEWACECGCGFDTVDAELVRVLEGIHKYFAILYKAEIRIIITGGNRCQDHNEIVQKEYNPDYAPFSSQSTHMDAKAGDFKVKFKVPGCHWDQVKPDLVADYLEKTYPDRYGIGRYNNRTHLDTRATKARWDKRKEE